MDTATSPNSSGRSKRHSTLSLKQPVILDVSRYACGDWLFCFAFCTLFERPGPACKQLQNSYSFWLSGTSDALASHRFVMFLLAILFERPGTACKQLQNSYSFGYPELVMLSLRIDSLCFCLITWPLYFVRYRIHLW